MNCRKALMPDGIFASGCLSSVHGCAGASTAPGGKNLLEGIPEKDFEVLEGKASTRLNWRKVSGLGSVDRLFICFARPRSCSAQSLLCAHLS